MYRALRLQPVMVVKVNQKSTSVALFLLLILMPSVNILKVAKLRPAILMADNTQKKRKCQNKF